MGIAYKYRRRASMLLLGSMLLFALAACGGGGGEGREEAEDGRLRVVCSIYPVYDFTCKIAGDLAVVDMLVPPGVEAHDWEPSTTDIVALEKADVLVLSGAGMEYWRDDIVGSLENKALVVVDSSGEIALRLAQDHDHDEEDHDHHGEDGHDHGEYDPHVWLNPLNAKEQLRAIATALALADPENADAYMAACEEWAGECDALDGEYRTGLAGVEQRNIVVAHEAYGYLCDAYDLQQIGIEGITPDSEPDPARMAEIIDTVEALGIDTIFYETAGSEKTAQAIADATGTKLDALNPIEGLSKADIEAGKDYFSEMRANLSALQRALG